MKRNSTGVPGTGVPGTGVPGTGVPGTCVPGTCRIYSQGLVTKHECPVFSM